MRAGALRERVNAIWRSRTYVIMKLFFEGYRKIRDNEVSANKLFEIPALLSLMPDLCGRKVLDLGCGY